LNKVRCIFCRHSSESLDFQGLAKWIQQLSTKLSTDNLSNCEKL
jgi:hypothetical protein